MKLLRHERRKTGVVAVFLRDENREYQYDTKADCMILPLAGVKARLVNLGARGETCLATEKALREWPT
jgi:hypothetical protein